MATYSKLLLSQGGGIISPKQQGEQVKNTATILIGLGGTGLDCLKSIKVAVRERLRPDDPEAAVPEYSHIQFLGVDSDKMALKKSGLEMKECLDISGALYSGMAGNPNMSKMRPELQWMDENLWQASSHLEPGNGAGGVRQMGRFLMMESSAEFMEILKKKIIAARRGLTKPHVSIYIFAGLSGGTGSGCFLDVCYMAREVLREVGGIISGYFFLPEVNETKIPRTLETIRKSLRLNGYAALQELDYTMGIQENGGAFQQEYQNGRVISWDIQPVDVCFLIGSNPEEEIRTQSYTRAISVITEYMLESCTDKNHHQSNTLYSRQRYDSWVIYAGRQWTRQGIYLDYRSLNMLSIYAPFREINTYLASKVFGMFGDIRSKEPTEKDVWHFAERAGLGNYELLCRELSQGAGDDYIPFPGTWQEVREYGDRELVIHYTNQSNNKMCNIERNARSMSDEKSSHSLIGRVREALASYIKSLEYGPMYAYRMMDESGANNLFRVIDTLIEKNTHLWNMKRFQYQDRYEEYERARDEFRKSSILTKRRRYKAYVYRFEILEQQKREIICCEQADRVLRTLRSQMRKVTAEYYLILQRVMGNLLDTFKENSDVLNIGTGITAKDFAEPLVTIEEVKPKLDQVLETINPAGMMDMFMGVFLDKESEWIQEDENAIAKMVNDFFVKKAFPDFANRSITSLLGDKYNTNNHEVITGRLYEDYIKELARKIEPLFDFDVIAWDEYEDYTSKRRDILVPISDKCVRHAAEKLFAEKQFPLFTVLLDALRDRLYLRGINCRFPICSHKKIKGYEELYYSSPIPVGLHSYVGNEKGFFSDWNRLPALTPESGIEYGKIPQRLKKELEEANELYDKAKELGLLRGDEVFYLDEEQKLKPSGHVLPHGFQKSEITIERVRRDFFVRSPALWEGLKKDIEVLEKSK